MTINGHFSIFVHFCLDIVRSLTNTVYAKDPNNSVIKRLWCILAVLLVTSSSIIRSKIKLPADMSLIMLDVWHTV